jgi:hypothetical protein
MKKGKLFLFWMLVVVLISGLVFTGCPWNKDDEKNDDGKNVSTSGTEGTSNTGGTSSSSIGCSSLSDGTKCSAQSSCSGKFLCLTGQGSDSNCTTGCSCNG